MSQIIQYYNQFDELGRLDREPLEFTINWHFIKKYLPIKGHILDNGAGPGKYAMELARSGYNVTLTDLTPKMVQVAVEIAETHTLSERFKGFHVADATNLNLFSNEAFDSSLMLGPLYHLQIEADREQAVKELYRVTKKGGYVFVAFMSRVKHLYTALKYPQSWKPTDNMADIQSFMETGVFNHLDEGRFTGAYYHRIEDIMPFMEAQGFESVKLIRSSSIAGSLTAEQFDYWRAQGDEEFHKFMEIVYDQAENIHLLGSGSHLLYIGIRK